MTQLITLSTKTSQIVHLQITISWENRKKRKPVKREFISGCIVSKDANDHGILVDWIQYKFIQLDFNAFVYFKDCYIICQSVLEIFVKLLNKKCLKSCKDWKQRLLIFRDWEKNDSCRPKTISKVNMFCTLSVCILTSKISYWQMSQIVWNLSEILTT